jgi:hypothetical protein
MSHLDANVNRSWKVRFSQGGNIYSYVGVYGEAMPPQIHANAPFIDEVWQMVAVNGAKNLPSLGKSYFIHQAGKHKKYI